MVRGYSRCILQSKGPEAIEHLELYLEGYRDGAPGNPQHVTTAQGLLEALTQAAAP